MTKARQFFETFNLALGRLIALLIGAIGVFLLYVAFSLGGTFWLGAIGLGFVLIAAAMLYWRVTILGILDFFASGASWN